MRKVNKIFQNSTKLYVGRHIIHHCLYSPFIVQHALQPSNIFYSHPKYTAAIQYPLHPAYTHAGWQWSILIGSQQRSGEYRPTSAYMLAAGRIFLFFFHTKYMNSTISWFHLTLKVSYFFNACWPKSPITLLMLASTAWQWNLAFSNIFIWNDL